MYTLLPTFKLGCRVYIITCVLLLFTGLVCYIYEQHFRDFFLCH